MSEEEHQPGKGSTEEHGSPRPAAEALSRDTGVKTEEKATKKRKSRRRAEEDLDSARQEAASYLDRLARLQAEFENYKKRQQRAREENQRSARERIIKDLLPVLDDLERAAQHAEPETDAEVLAQGVELVLKQFREALSHFGLEHVPASGEVFDPHLHEAMSRIETDGDPPDGTVVEEYRKGYLLNGKVLRPAMVGVAKLVAEEKEEQTE